MSIDLNDGMDNAPLIVEEDEPSINNESPNIEPPEVQEEEVSNVNNEVMRKKQTRAFQRSKRREVINERKERRKQLEVKAITVARRARNTPQGEAEAQAQSRQHQRFRRRDSS